MRSRLAIYLILVSGPLSSQTNPPSPSPTPYPFELQADLHALYSLVLERPPIRLDGNSVYLIQDTTGEFYSEIDPAQCIKPDPEDREAFDEILAAYAAGKTKRHLIQPRMRTAKPFQLVDEAVARVFIELRRPRPTTDPKEFARQFPQSTHLIRLGNVYFNRLRTLAMVSISAYCGPTCGQQILAIYRKGSDGTWAGVQPSFPICPGIISRHALTTAALAGSRSRS